MEILPSSGLGLEGTPGVVVVWALARGSMAVLRREGTDWLRASLLLSRREVSARQDAMTYLVRVRGLLSGW